jgi:hypothetical protein
LLAPPRRIDLELNDLDFHVVADRVVRPDGAVDGSPIIEPAVNVLQEIRSRVRSMGAVDADLDVALLGFECEDGVRRRVRGEGEHDRDGGRQLRPARHARTIHRQNRR